MKRIIFGILLCVGANATQVSGKEADGIFVGLELGISGSDLKLNQTRAQTNDPISIKGDSTNIFYGLLFGYKHFINDYFGLRYYINLSLENSLNSDVRWYAEGGGDVSPGKIKSMQFGADANIDALFNFINAQSSSFGAYLGAYLGYQSMLTLESSDTTFNAETFVGKPSGFDFGINVGLRGVFATNHGVELGAKVPFIYAKTTQSHLGSDGTATTTTIKTKNAYIISAKYIYSF